MTCRAARATIACCVTLPLAIGGCGGDETGEPKPPAGQTRAEFEQVVKNAGNVSAADFPKTRGRTLQQVANTVRPGPKVGLATSVYTPGRNRLAFGLIDDKQRFVYGKSAVYVAPSPKAKAVGPFPAPAQPLVVEPPFRSRGAAAESDPIAAIYAAGVELATPAKYEVLVMTKLKDGTFGAPAVVKVSRRSPVPEAGEQAPKPATDTLAAAGGDIKAIDTRDPADDMHDTSFKDVVGKKPVALLFATPALCESRVCGPVTDIALQLKQQYGDRVEFIHQEVYVDNEIKKGLRPPLRAFNLQTEPWLFTIDRRGRVAARLEGSFGTPEFERAVKAAL